VNLCRACRHDFSSVRLFDAHRVGRHTCLFDSEHLDGGRCLDASEMDAKRWARNECGRWSDPAVAEDARTRFSKAA
jgi:hypothetical protein